MKFNYLFVDQNNGHFKTYHPFTSNTVLSQEKVTDWLMQVPGADRMGTTVTDLFHRLDKEKIHFERFCCPCCEQPVENLQWDEHKMRYWNIVVGIQWIFLEGIGGNY